VNQNGGDDQDDMDRAKTQSRKGKPEQAVLCALASLREIGFPWLLEDEKGSGLLENTQQPQSERSWVDISRLN
jgi:hypothetical protein